MKKLIHLLKVLMVVYLSSVSCFANNLEFFYLDTNKCDLFEMGWKSKKNPTIYNGDELLMGKSKTCTVYLSSDKFSKEYDFCVNNGFSSANTSEFQKCYFGKSTNGNFFFQSTGEITCYYMCKKNQ